MSQSLLDTMRLIKADMQMRCEYEHKKLSFLRILRFCVYSASASTILYRMQVFFYHNHMGLIARFVSFLNTVLFVVKIDPTAKIGPGFLLLHASCITVGPNVVIGRNCIMAHQNTVTPSQFFNANHENFAAPVIGNHLFMGTGAVITGAITLGDYVQVSANAVVDQSYPDHAVLFGVPAKNVTKHDLSTHHA